MDFMTPPMYDTFNFVVWKVKMSMYLKPLGLHVFLVATKKSYLGNSMHIEANAPVSYTHLTLPTKRIV